MHCCIPTPTTDSSGIIFVTLNMPSAMNREGIHIVWRVVTVGIVTISTVVSCFDTVPVACQ